LPELPFVYFSRPKSTESRLAKEAILAPSTNLP
jgi:hypothetical protein